MVLTKRQNDILFFLCGQREYVTIKQLALRFDVSGRTIQNDLAFIGSFLSGSKAVIDKKSGKGIRINVDEPEIYNLRRELDSLNNRALSNDERMSLIALLLLCNPVNTFESLSDACYVS